MSKAVGQPLLAELREITERFESTMSVFRRMSDLASQSIAMAAEIQALGRRRSGGLALARAIHVGLRAADVRPVNVTSNSSHQK